MNTQGRNSQRGSVLAELTFVLPFIVFLISGVISLGQVLSQVAWISETAYQATLTGAEVANQIVSEGAMIERANTLSNTAKTASKVARMLSWESVSSTQNRADELVTVSFQARLNTIFGNANILPLSISVSGPILTNLEQDISDLGVFKNPALQRDCSGNVCSAGTCPNSCLTCDSAGLNCSWT